MPRNRMLEGSLVQREDLTDACWTTVQQFVKMLIGKVGVSFPVNLGDDFVVYGFQTPSEDSKNKLWVKTDRNGHFQGFWIFIDGAWNRVYNYSANDVIWKWGDSRFIEPGFALIDGTLPEPAVQTQQHIMGFYRLDPGNSTPTEPVYNYFATLYIGL